MLKRFINWLARKTPQYKALEANRDEWRDDYLEMCARRSTWEKKARGYQDVLVEITGSIESITTPNGTLRKIRRMANEGLAG
ncbi:hypothetical protein SAMN03159338_1468 [Sphingomonas sp. NFR04]|uniref:hypothetical protein n=1 Tax=Sphingomonas sp. NFR04 TaxID=1566283 RepID=UPI0008E17E76|nr:hypothetical protein [Sphingomonas sp. NFR04]SFJ46745.1 hypothetical protein SAMN03159338_1468 [Sphingomonas sp. NFR04]